MKLLRKILIALVVCILAATLFLKWAMQGHPTDRPISATEGLDITLAEPKEETFPTVNISNPVGWGEKEAPQAAQGLAVNRFASGLNHPRTMLLLPNGDVLVAETDHPVDRTANGPIDKVKQHYMNKAGAANEPPNAVILLRDDNGDGVAEQRFVLRKDDMDSPSGLAWGDGKLYIANHNAILAFDFKPGDTALTGKPKKILDLPPAGDHWMRNLLLSADGKKLFVAIGSATNIADNGIEAEARRAAIYQIDIATGHSRQFAGGLRNPNGMDFNPASGELWTAVVERDKLGGDLVPDYLTNVPVGVQYGWPWYYWKKYQDPRVHEPMPLYLQEYVRKPEFALGAHTTPLGMRFSVAGNRMGPAFANGAFVARHGSWNRMPASGYDVVFVKFDDRGNPLGMPIPVLTGFRKDEQTVHGRPTWIAFDKTGALLVTDDTAGIIWRVMAPGAAPSLGVKALPDGKIPPKRSLDGAMEAEIRRKLQEAYANQNP